MPIRKTDITKGRFIISGTRLLGAHQIVQQILPFISGMGFDIFCSPYVGCKSRNQQKCKHHSWLEV